MTEIRNSSPSRCITSQFAPDNYSTSPDGQVVGPNGFVVPRNSQEFLVRFPYHVHSFVRRRMAHRPFHEIQERVDELICFLTTLPAESRYRQPGTNGHAQGCTDRIMTFSPVRSHGASTGQFLSYINRLLLNHFISLERRREHDPVIRKGTLRIGDEDHDQAITDSDDEIGVDQLHRLGMRIRATEEPSQLAEIACFIDFVRRHNPDLLTVLAQLVICGSPIETRSTLGLSERLFNRARGRLKTLYQCFCNGQTPRRQRRIYRDRRAVGSATRPTNVISV